MRLEGARRWDGIVHGVRADGRAVGGRLPSGQPEWQTERVVDQVNGGEILATRHPFVGHHGPDRSHVAGQMGLQVRPRVG